MSTTTIAICIYTYTTEDSIHDIVVKSIDHDDTWTTFVAYTKTAPGNPDHITTRRRANYNPAEIRNAHRPYREGLSSQIKIKAVYTNG